MYEKLCYILNLFLFAAKDTRYDDSVDIILRPHIWDVMTVDTGRRMSQMGFLQIPRK